MATANDHGWMAPCGADAVNEPARYKEAWTKLSSEETKALAISWGAVSAGGGRHGARSTVHEREVPWLERLKR